MMLCEILAPAGTPEDVPAVIEAGADAIYVGLSGYSARPKSADFSREDIVRVLPFLRERRAPLYVAVNANIPDAELPHFYEDLRFLDALPVDALIISNYGVLFRAASIVRRARLHASTLTGVYNREDVRQLQAWGVSRVIFSSDLFIDEIAALTEAVPDMEYEIVADGGICFHSNRQCLLPHRGEGTDYQVWCQKHYDLFREGRRMGPALKIGNPPGKIHRTMGLYCGGAGITGADTGRIPFRLHHR